MIVPEEEISKVLKLIKDKMNVDIPRNIIFIEETERVNYSRLTPNGV